MVYNFQGLKITVSDEDNNTCSFSVEAGGDSKSNLSSKWILIIDNQKDLQI